MESQSSILVIQQLIGRTTQRVEKKGDFQQFQIPVTIGRLSRACPVSVRIGLMENKDGRAGVDHRNVSPKTVVEKVVVNAIDVLQLQVVERLMGVDEVVLGHRDEEVAERHLLLHQPVKRRRGVGGAVVFQRHVAIVATTHHHGQTVCRKEGGRDELQTGEQRSGVEEQIAVQIPDECAGNSNLQILHQRCEQRSSVLV